MHKIKQLGKNILISLIVVTVFIAGISFYAGVKYNQTQGAALRAQFTGQFGGGTGGRTGSMRGGGFIVGNILSKDATGITISSRDGGSKIIFIGSSSEIMKAATGTVDDLIVGQAVSVTGTTNADGSVTAQNIQIRPNMPGSPQGGTPKAPGQ